jgi:hypothetical protein
MAEAGNTRDDTRDGGRGVGALLKDLADGSGELIRHEVRLARLEAAELLGKAGAGVAAVATGGVLALLGALALLAGLILLAGDQWLRDRYWLAALLVTAIAGVVALVFARRGLALLSPKALLPDQTVATLKEDKEWLRQLRT